MVYANLHVHTTLSDGSFSLIEVLILAQELGIKAIGVTDHDSLTLDIPETDIEVINGFELSLEKAHICGYFPDIPKKEDLEYILKNDPHSGIARLLKHQEQAKKRKEMKYRDAQKVLAEKNYITDEHIDPLNPQKLHLVQGVRQTQGIEYQLALSIVESHLTHKESGKKTIEEGIELIRSVYGIPILMHMFLKSYQAFEQAFNLVDGFEIWYPYAQEFHSKIWYKRANVKEDAEFKFANVCNEFNLPKKEQQQFFSQLKYLPVNNYNKFCEHLNNVYSKLGLHVLKVHGLSEKLKTGGSDFHGMYKSSFGLNAIGMTKEQYGDFLLGAKWILLQRYGRDLF